jgi:hypothetical protein
MVYKSRFIFIFIAVAIIFGLPSLSFAAGDEDDSQPLCLPDFFYDPTQDCSPYGPTAYILEMAEVGFTFPETPLPIQKPDPTLSEVEYLYAYVLPERAPIYRTLTDAVEKNKQHIIQRTTPGFTYVSISRSAVSNGKYYYYNDVGWMSADDLLFNPVPTFQGVEFLQTPEHDFGWILSMFAPGGKTETKRTPGYDRDDYTGRYLEHQDLVQIYDTVTVGNWDWYMIGPDEWLNQRTVAKVSPRSSPPEGLTWTRWIEVNLYEQTLAVYEDNELIFATLVASGKAPLFTYPGIFTIEEKLDLTGMRWLAGEDISYNLASVPWTMYFDEDRAFHGAYWRASLGYPQSHGCVNLSVGDSHWLYNWADLGEHVYVYDPSGETPLSESDR